MWCVQMDICNVKSISLSLVSENDRWFAPLAAGSISTFLSLGSSIQWRSWIKGAFILMDSSHPFRHTVHTRCYIGWWCQRLRILNKRPIQGLTSLLYNFLQNRIPDQYRRALIDLTLQISIRTHHISPFGPAEADIAGPSYRLCYPSLRVGREGVLKP